MDLQQFAIKLKEKYPDENVEIISFISSSKPAEYKCLKCGRTYSQQRAYSILNKTTLCICGREKLLMAQAKERFLKRLKEKYPQQEIELIKFETSRKEIIYRCKNCQKEYYLSKGYSIYRRTTLCFDCYPHQKTSGYRDWINNFIFNSSQFDFAGEWDGKVGKDSAVPIICHKCGRTQIKNASNMINSTEQTLCCFCGKNGQPVDLDIYLSRMEKNDKKDYEVLEYKDMKHSIKVKHSCGFVFTQNAQNFLTGLGCPKCYRKMSKGEVKIENWLKEHQIFYETQKRFDFNLHLSFDFYLPDYNTLIEYQGRQHYEPVEYFGGEEQLQKQKDNDKAKAIFCENNNYNLVAIPYYDFDEIEKYLIQIIGPTTIRKE